MKLNMKLKQKRSFIIAYTLLPLGVAGGLVSGCAQVPVQTEDLTEGLKEEFDYSGLGYVIEPLRDKNGNYDTLRDEIKEAYRRETKSSRNP